MTQVGIAVLSMFMGLSSLAAPVDGADPLAFEAFDDIVNHYKCYEVKPIDDQFFPPVTLSDQFKQSNAQVIRPRYLCNPTKKRNNATGSVTPIVDFDIHYVCFDIVQNVDPELPRVHTSNQFGRQLLQPIKTELLCLPSKKTHL